MTFASLAQNRFTGVAQASSRLCGKDVLAACGTLQLHDRTGLLATPQKSYSGLRTHVSTDSDADIPERARNHHSSTNVGASSVHAAEEHSPVIDWSDRADEVIRKLPSELKIYDLYSWQEVLQEEGDGGKRTCQKSQEGSPLAML